MPDEFDIDDFKDGTEGQEKAPGYDEWLRAAVQAAIDDPRPSIPHEEVEAHFKALREAAKRRRLAKLAKEDPGQ